MNRLKRVISQVRKAAAVRSVPAQVLDLISHRVVLCLRPADYYRFEFYRPGKTWEEKSRYVAMDGSVYWPFENNEAKFGIALTDKYVQKHLLLGLGLPTPRLLATAGANRDIRSPVQWREFLDTVDQPLVLKPVSSASGEGILIVEKRGDQLYSTKAAYTSDQLWDYMQRVSKRGFLIEERATNAGILARLNPTSLNTFRVVTIKTNDGVWHVATIVLHIGAPGRMVDNEEDSGYQVYFDESGKPRQAYDFARGQAITQHPETGIDLLNLEVDGYREVADLALRASQKFNFLGTVGWDIAWTDRGAMIIEGNIVWECNYLQRGVPGIINDTLAKGLTRHSIFYRWDKSRLYPGYDRLPLWLKWIKRPT